MKNHHIIFTRLAAIFFIVCGVLGGIAVLPAFAQTSNTNESASQISEIKDKIRQLFELQDSTTIPQQDKDTQEFKLRRATLTLIVETALKQTSVARDEFRKVQLPNSDDWKQIYNSILSSFEASLAYYRDIEDHIDTDSTLTSALLKNIARDMEQKKVSEIDPLIKKSHAIVAAFNVSDMLKIADERLTKIKLDVDQIYTQKLTRSQTLKQLFEKASVTLNDAHDLNTTSKEIILNAYTTPETGSSTEYINTLYKKLRLEEKTLASSTQLANDVSHPDAAVIETYLQKIITDSITHIKSAYDIFMKMSSNVKAYLK